MPSSMVRDIYKWAKARGWDREPTSAGHYKYTHPDFSQFVISPGTPSDRRCFEAFKSSIRRVERAAQGSDVRR